MGKYTGYEIMNNNNEDGSGRFQAHDWSPTKAGAIREAKRSFEIIQNSGLYQQRTAKLVVIAVDTDTGEVVGGRMEV